MGRGFGLYEAEEDFHFLRLPYMWGRVITCSLHCSSFFCFNHVIYLKDFISYPQKGTAMETIGKVLGAV